MIACLLLFRSLLGLTVAFPSIKSSIHSVRAFSVHPVSRTRPQRCLFPSATSNDAASAVSDETYQTNLEIAKLASESPKNVTAALIAQQLLKKLPHPDTVTYNGVLKALAKSPSIHGAQQAQDLLEQMEEVHQQQSLANREFYLKISSNGNDFVEGAPLITVKPNVRSYSTVMDAWSRRSGKIPNAPQRAQDILERLEHIHASTGDMSYRPNTISYNTVIAAWAKDGIFDKAHLLLEKMGPLADTISYNTVLLAIARSALPDAGERAEQLMRKMVVRPNARTYTTVIDAWSRSHNSTRALALLCEMEELYETTGDVSIRPNCISYSTVINAYALSREPNKATMAWELLQRMKELSDSGTNVHAKPSLITYNSVLNACATCSSIEHEQVAKMVHVLYREIQQDPSLQPDHFTYGTGK